MKAATTGCSDLCEVLLSYLRRTKCFLSADITREDVLNLYDSAMEHGQVPNRVQLLQRHPDLTESIGSCIARPIRE